MAIAKGMRRHYSDSMIRDTAAKAALAKRTPEALSALGVGLFNDYQTYNKCIKRNEGRCKNKVKKTGIVEKVSPNGTVLVDCVRML